MEKNKRTKASRLIALMLAIITALSLCNVTEAQAAAKLTKDDFTYSSGGFTYNIIDTNQSIGLDRICHYAYYRDNFFNTNRGIEIGDSLSKVEEAYGKATVNKIVKNDPVYTTIKDCLPSYNMEAWRYYLEYKYTTVDKYKLCIRFYFNKKDKLDMVVYTSDDYKGAYCSKFFKSGIKFVASKGKKITTKTIDGKKVYMVPKDSTFIFKKNNKYNVTVNAKIVNNPYIDGGDSIWYDEDSYTSYKYLKYNKSYSVKSYFTKVYDFELDKKVSLKSVGDYKYMYLKLEAAPADFNENYNKVPIPEYVYFKIVD